MQHVRYNLPDCRRQLPFASVRFRRAAAHTGQKPAPPFFPLLNFELRIDKTYCKIPDRKHQKQGKYEAVLGFTFFLLCFYRSFFGSHFASLPSAFSDNCAYYLIDYTTKSRIVSSGFLIFLPLLPLFFDFFVIFFQKLALKTQIALKTELQGS